MLVVKWSWRNEGFEGKKRREYQKSWIKQLKQFSETQNTRLDKEALT